MENDIDPLVSDSIAHLVSALGGPDRELPDAPYVLGDDALGCLKDIKIWIKAYDEKLNRLDVARAITETGLVENDLMRIVTDWEAAGRAVGARYRIALACGMYLHISFVTLSYCEIDTNRSH